MFKKLNDEKDKKLSLKYHDNFNIVMLSFIIIFILIYLLQTTELSNCGIPRVNAGEENELIFTYTILFIFYLIVDIIWVILEPNSVKASPISIIIHHIFALIISPIPYLIPKFRRHFAGVSLSEINTFFLILRRNTEKDSFSYNLCHYLFLISWIIFRIIMLPVITYFLIFEYTNHSSEINCFYNIRAIPPLLTGALTLMSFYWTYDIIAKLKKEKKVNN